MRNGFALHLAILSSYGKFGNHISFGTPKLIAAELLHEEAALPSNIERAYCWHPWNLCISQSSAGVASPQVCNPFGSPGSRRGERVPGWPPGAKAHDTIEFALPKPTVQRFDDLAYRGDGYEHIFVSCLNHGPDRCGSSWTPSRWAVIRFVGLAGCVLIHGRDHSLALIGG